MSRITPTLPTLLGMQIISSKSLGSRAFHHTFYGGVYTKPLPLSLVVSMPLQMSFPVAATPSYSVPLSQCRWMKEDEEKTGCLWPLWA